jgi:4'-phosphopantetheinyl transferase
MRHWHVGTTSDRGWLLPPEPEDLTLTGEEVHVWRASLNWPAGYVRRFQDLLTPDELSRSERFRFQADRQRFLVARGLLRTILSRYLRVEPGQLRFAHDERGKPHLISPSASRALAFNLSHAHGLLLIAVTHNRRVGIDVEYTRPPLPDVEHIAERFFSVEEKEVLRALSPTARNEAFFRCWTCKEAYLKARGEGLSMPLDRFQVAVIPGQPARLLRVEGDLKEASRWSLRELVPAPGYVATLAVEGGGWRLSCWRYPCSLQGETQVLAEMGPSAPLRAAYPT